MITQQVGYNADVQEDVEAVKSLYDTPTKQPMAQKRVISKPQPIIQSQKRQSHQWRHFKALMWKNGVNWKRTWFGSILEIVCPILLMLILVWARTQILVTSTPAFDFYYLKKPMYPTSSLINDTWTDRNFEIAKQGAEMISFLEFANYTPAVQVDPLGTLYTPLLDPISPYYFWAPHCYTTSSRYASPKIAYIEQGNQIEKDMIQQLELLFAKQRYLVNFTESVFDALENPSSPESIATFLELLDGGSGNQQIQLLGAFGVPQPVVTILQFLAVSNTNQTEGLTPNQTQQLILDAIAQSRNQTAQVQQLISTQQIATTQFLQAVTVQDFALAFGLDRQQTQVLLDQITRFLVPDPETTLNQIVESATLDQTESQALEQLIQNLNQTQNAQINLPTDALQTLVLGNMTLAEFEEQTNSTIELVASSIGLTPSQLNQLTGLVDLQQNALLFSRVVQAQGDQTTLGQLAPQFRVTQAQIDLLALAARTELPITPQITTQLLSLDTRSQLLLLAVLSNEAEGDVMALVDQTSKAFNLNPQQTQATRDLFQQALDTPLEAATDRKSTEYQFFEILLGNKTPSVDVLDPLLSTQVSDIVTGIAPGTDPVERLASLNETDVRMIAEALNLGDDAVTLIMAVTGQINLFNSSEFGPRVPQGFEQDQVGNNQASQLEKLFKTANAKQFGQFSMKSFKSQAEFDAYIEHELYGEVDDRPGICWGFNIIENAENDYELELMFNDLWPRQIRSLPRQTQPGANPTQSTPMVQEYSFYVQNGYSLVQNWFANTILRRKTKQSAQIVNMITPFKVPQIQLDGLKFLLQLGLTLFILLSYIPVIYRTVYRIVFEKNTKAKESMRIMGMTDLPYWLSWWCYYSIVNTVLATCAWCVLMVNIFKPSSGFMLWAIMWLYGQSIFGLILITQSFFQTPRAAAITCTVFYFGITIFGAFIDAEDTAFITKFWVCLFFPQIAMIQSIQVFIAFVTSEIPMNFSTWQLQFEQFSVVEGLFLLFLSQIIMILIGVYLEKVMPKTYGARQHPCFCVKNLCRRRTARELDIKPQPNNNDCEFETQYLKPECFEPVAYETRQKEQTGEILKVSNLKKVYENGFKAVNGLNIKMYADQIFVLLGHNGAGKTTTISMLTGLLSASEGSAEVFGVDMFSQMDDVRRVMGVCPQHDVLFELLTVQEHLSFFYDLKGANPDIKVKQAEIEKLMHDCGVYDKRNALAYQLSGGNKRKLSVAIALCGNSRFVLLDEPTSGMDLQARRQLWNMLKEYKKDRIVVLTTHYMDEADILGDRIGIMAKGKMTCLGSSIFLKSKFGVGYNLTVVKNSRKQNTELMSFLTEKLGSEVVLQSEIQSEMTITIPQRYSTKFAEFFAEFDRSLEHLNIQSYGISISTLEEVFLKIGHLDDPVINPVTLAAQTSHDEDGMAKTSTPFQLQKELQNIKTPQVALDGQTDFNLKDNVKELDTSFWTCFIAVLFKRIMNYRRNKKAVFNEVVIPAIMVLVGFGISKLQPAWRSDSQIQTFQRLPQPQHLIFNSEPVRGNVDIWQLAEGLPRTEGTKLIISNFTGSQEDMYAFGDAVYDFGQNFRQPPFMYGSYQIYEADTETQQYKVLTFVNLTSQDAPGLYPQFIYESILKTATGDPNFKFKLRSTPYPPTWRFRYRLETFNAGNIIFVTAIAYAVMITTVVSYLVTERIQGLKHLQEISGLQLKAYWVGNFVVDFIKMQLTIGMTLLLFEVFDMGIDISMIVYSVFPFGVLPFTYVSSFLFSADSAAQTFTMFFHFLSVSILPTVAFALRLAPSQEAVGDILNQAFKVIPSYIIAASVYCETSCDLLSTLRSRSTEGTGGPLTDNLWDITNILGDIIIPFFHIVCWSILLIMIEKNYFKWMIIGPNKRLTAEAIELDDDVQREADRIKKNEDENHQIQVQNLKKVYRTKSKRFCKSDSLIAVSNLSFSLQSGECFALLGVNGAGKSTTFKSLTCEVKPTSGKIKIAGFDVSKQFEKAKKLIGYCPQPNLIFDSMSVEEHIYYYARIKGIPYKYRTQEVEKAIKQLGLEDHRKKPAGTLSGGNKRKVCVAQALIGSPPIILLDEPSAGMDPEARRFMWSVVAKIAQNKTSAVVLTTHSMEEAEALCTKMGIMVKGGIFKCFGSAQHIRNKFGTGYVIELKTKSVEEKDIWELVQQHYDNQRVLQLAISTQFDDSVIKQIQARVEGQTDVTQQYREVFAQTNLHQCIACLCETFTRVELIEHYGNYMRLRVQRLDKSIGSVFGLVEQFKATWAVESYSVSQTTLEQIFQGFADEHFNEDSILFGLKAKENGSDNNDAKLTIIE